MLIIKSMHVISVQSWTYLNLHDLVLTLVTFLALLILDSTNSNPFRVPFRLRMNSLGFMIKCNL